MKSSSLRVMRSTIAAWRTIGSKRIGHSAPFSETINDGHATNCPVRDRLRPGWYYLLERLRLGDISLAGLRVKDGVGVADGLAFDGVK